MKEDIKTHGVTSSNYGQLCQATLAQVILFNRRRSGKTQYLKLTTFQNNLIRTTDAGDDIIQSLGISEKVAMDRLSLLYRRGKRDRGVPIMLPDDLKESLEVLFENRKEAGVHPDNIYVSARCGSSLQPFQGCDVMKKFA
ncbi:hypothetical protein HOLleu_44455 [Holothuria leucospilota]|uniref:Uncharacterized protein n=1 Tax=Holothuria leucospilota TaxID=206669 RepID=A0A9Q0Y9L7_HOLLE|nr:hypothetical protein HOLleu_44455 [Holothuria leucospilota]